MRAATKNDVICFFPDLTCFYKFLRLLLCIYNPNVLVKFLDHAVVTKGVVAPSRNGRGPKLNGEFELSGPV
jgi:hypothetical protein